MLNISPFSFGLLIQQVYDNGSVYSPEVLDITEAALHARFLQGVRNIASVCLEIGYPTLASIPHTIINTVLHTIYSNRRLGDDVGIPRPGPCRYGWHNKSISKSLQSTRRVTSDLMARSWCPVRLSQALFSRWRKRSQGERLGSGRSIHASLSAWALGNSTASSKGVAEQPMQRTTSPQGSRRLLLPNVSFLSSLD
ncbi:hypothetical protein DPEC_G00227810 [Dallia pectoralis]|uniref:Uncharacterized protein n=1 Tax=Dallia pectoralis TaxID=75939 RepID=A0ACC2G188_DALPE|nr:hypothetical protein DPEC_G00227810 [Dallia pectoralis]